MSKSNAQSSVRTRIGYARTQHGQIAGDNDHQSMRNRNGDTSLRKAPGLYIDGDTVIKAPIQRKARLSVCIALRRTTATDTYHSHYG